MVALHVNGNTYAGMAKEERVQMLAEAASRRAANRREDKGREASHHQRA